LKGLFEIEVEISKTEKIIYGLLPFFLLISGFIIFAQIQLAETPTLTLYPSADELVNAFSRNLHEDDTGKVKLLVDTIATMKRFFVSLLIIWTGAFFGLYMGMFPRIRAILYPVVNLFDKVTAIILYPLFMILFGAGDTAKVAVVVVGVMPTIVLDAMMRTKNFDHHQVVKGATMHAGSLENAHFIVLPQIYPEVLETIKLNLKTIAGNLLATEMLQAFAGLGFRLYLSKRENTWPLVYDYSIYIALLIFVIFWIFSYWIKHRYKFREQSGGN
jgi:NitT/TauT family transport system permease protein